MVKVGDSKEVAQIGDLVGVFDYTVENGRGNDKDQ